MIARRHFLQFAAAIPALARGGTGAAPTVIDLGHFSLDCANPTEQKTLTKRTARASRTKLLRIIVSC